MDNSGFLGFRKSLSDTEYGYKVVTSPHPIRAGINSIRFELRDGDCGSQHNWSDCENDRSRVEIISKKEFLLGENKWFAWSIYIDESYEDVYPTKTTLGQIVQYEGPSGIAGGYPSYPPLIQFEIVNGNYVLTHHELTGDKDNIIDQTKNFKLISLSEMKGAWIDFVMHIKFEKDGLLEFFVNGEHQLIIDKNLMHFEPEKFYFKFGIYNAFVSRYKNKFGKKLPTQIVYFDEVRTGDNRESVDLRYNPNLLPVD